MKNKLILTIGLLYTIIAHTSLLGQSLQLDWKIETGGKILASPITDKNHAYVGNDNGTFFALEIETGKISWKVETNGKIQSKALLIDNIVFFESANNFYALNKKDGSQLWKYSSQIEPEKFTYSGVDYQFILDPYDDKHASAIFYNGIIFTGTSYGEIIGLDVKTGKIEFTTYTIKNAPVRATPYIKERKLYYGDWNGVVYSYDLEQDSILWHQNTYREKPYGTFGGIASEFLIHKGKLFFGARNPMLNVLWIENGQKEWTYTDPEKGWLIGDPVIKNDTVYVGGSDNYSMLALDSNDGRLLWKSTRKKNIYAKAVVTEQWVIYGGGNSYDPKDTGEIVVLDRKDGHVIDIYVTSSSVFSAPNLTINRSILFGSNDGTIYALKLLEYIK